MTCGDPGKMTEMTKSPLSGVGGVAYIDKMVDKKNRLRFCAYASVASLLLKSISNPVMGVKEGR